MEPTAGLRIREAARALVLTPSFDVLLVRFEFPAGTRWALPGGGIDPGETAVTALQRELAEEVGLHQAVIGAHLWNRLHVVPFLNGQFDGQREQVHLVEVPARFEPAPALTWEQLRAEYVHEVRWWHLDDIRDATHLRFVPGDLAALVDALGRHGPPSAPIDVGV